jgi:hypothetical protein
MIKALGLGGNNKNGGTITIKGESHLGVMGVIQDDGS